MTGHDTPDHAPQDNLEELEANQKAHIPDDRLFSTDWDEASKSDKLEILKAGLLSVMEDVESLGKAESEVGDLFLKVADMMTLVQQHQKVAKENLRLLIERLERLEGRSGPRPLS